VAPLIELDFGFSATKIGGFMSAIAVFTMFGSVFGIRWANRTFKKNSLLIFNTFILTVGVLLVIIADLFFRNHFNWLIWIAIIPIATGNIVLYCELAALFMAEANKGLMGITMAIFYFVVNLTWLLTAMVGGIAEAVSPLTPMIVAPVGSIMLLVFLFKATDQKT
jgi:predicted MFS family arabinose efflux permease